MYDLTALRSDAEHKRHTLTALRLEVSEGPTVSSLVSGITAWYLFVCLFVILDTGHCQLTGHYNYFGVRYSDTTEQSPSGEDTRLASTLAGEVLLECTWVNVSKQVRAESYSCPELYTHLSIVRHFLSHLQTSAGEYLGQVLVHLLLRSVLKFIESLR